MCGQVDRVVGRRDSGGRGSGGGLANFNTQQPRKLKSMLHTASKHTERTPAQPDEHTHASAAHIIITSWLPLTTNNKEYCCLLAGAARKAAKVF